ncbi:ATP-binding protein [Pseudoxanthomonas taiwanensis]|nr:ATP-binding protein [Pseudoxanthomonas taiwanensis]
MTRMSMRRMPGLLLVLALALAGAAWAAVPDMPRFRITGASEGLPSTNVTALARDRQGYLWVATWDGLARYDGVGFRVWRHDPKDPASLPGNLLQALYVDSRDRVWVASENGGISVMDAGRGGFRHYRQADHPELASDDVFAIAGDDDSVWLGTYGGGLYRVDGQDHIARARAGDAEIDGALDTAIFSLVFDGDGGLYIGTLAGLVHRDGGGRMRLLELPDEKKRAPVVALWREKDATWVGTTRGLYRLRGDGRWDSPAWARAFKGHQVVTAMAQDGMGGYWVATRSGFWHVDSEGDTHQALHEAQALGVSQVVQALLRLEDGALWVGVPTQGLGYLRPDWRRVAVLDKSHGLGGGLYRAIGVAARGGVWLAGSLGELEHLDTATGKAAAFAYEVPGDNRVRSLLEARDGSLWIGAGPVLMRIARDGKVRHWKRDSEEDPAPGGSTVDWLLEAPDGSVWVATSGGGLQRRDGRTGRVLEALKPGMVEGLERVDITEVRLGPEGLPWIVEEGRLLRWDPVRRAFLPLPGLETGPIITFVLDGPRRLWVQGLSGVQMWEEVRGTWQLRERLGVDDGVPATEATGLVVDQARRLWLGTRRGLFRIEPSDGARPARVSHFGVREGLPSQELVENALALDARGVLVAALGDGSLLLLDTTMPDPDPVVPYLVIDGVKVRRGDDELALPVGGAFTLQPGDRDLQVTARLLAFDDPQSIRYRFHLAGYDTDWVPGDSDGERVFSQLPPGSYRLEVQAAARGQDWSPVRELAFTVAPPWWRSGWGMLLLACCVLLLLGWGAWAYRRRLRRRAQLQLEMHKRELAEQASLAKSRFLATLGHEVRTPMTGVLGMSELLLDTPLDGRQRGYVEAIRRAGEHLLRLVNDALDLARIEAGRLELDEQDFDLRALVAEVVALMAPVAEQRGLAFHVRTAPEAPRWLRGDPVRLRQILLNLLGNAVKFTERGEVVLGVAALQPQGVVFVVRDTGPGLDESQKERLFRRFEQADGARTTTRYGGSGLGLAICQELAVAMGGRIGVESAPGQGATFRVELPLPAGSVPAVAERPVRAGQRSLDLLLVEDDPTVAEVIASLLRAQGHRVAHAAHGLAALADVAVARFDLTLLDLDLPGLDGLSLARQLRAQGFTPPLLAITSRPDAEAEQAAREAGFDGFLRKPVTGEMLAAAIDAVLPEEPAAV